LTIAGRRYSVPGGQIKSLKKKHEIETEKTEEGKKG